MPAEFIQTVTGPIRPETLGKTLSHEHLLVDFIGAGSITRNRYSRDAAFQRMLPYLKQIAEQGIQSFVECTPMYLGRDPVLFRSLSVASGIAILVSTGQYAAGQREGSPEPFLPSYAFTLEAEHLAGGWLKEWYEGIESTDVKPGFIKIGVNPGEMRQISEKIVKAAAITSRYSGLVIACHTVQGRSALRIIDILERQAVTPDRYIYVHAQGEKDPSFHEEVARRGAWVSLDGIGPESARQHLEFIQNLFDKGFHNRVLVSQDAGWYRPGEKDGGHVRGFDYLLDQFVPMMKKSGITDQLVETLLVHNPAAAFSVKS